jgi:two-component system chemotaxis response regulator CheY
MKMIARPCCHHLRQRGEQRLAFLRREHGGGFVEDQDAGAAVQRLEDLHALALAHRQAADQRVGRHRQAEALRHLEQLGRAARARDTAATSGSVPSITLSSTLRLSASVKCWCTMPMPAASAARAGRAAAARPKTSMRPASACSGRTGSTSASTCRRRFRQQGQHLAGISVQRDASLATSAPKRLVMPVRRSTGAKRPAWTVVEAASGEEALTLVAQQCPDFCTMDINMPGLLGTDAAEQIKRDHPAIRLALFSANIQESQKTRASQIGVKFVAKPVSEKSVLEALAYFESSTPTGEAAA